MNFRNLAASAAVDWQSSDRPRWAGIAVGLVGFGVALVLASLPIGLFASGTPVWQGVIGSYAGGIAGLSGFAAAYLIRRSRPALLGLKTTSASWYMAAAVLAAGGYGLSLMIIDAHARITGNVDDSQSILHAAIQGGVAPFLLAFLGGALLTPLGEEFLFRGIIANALNRYGACAGIGLSAIIFGVAHGTGVVMWVAIMMGLFSGVLFRQTGSVWPSVCLHMVYNALHSVGSALS